MITPEQLAKSGSEDGNQAALFCWAQLNLQRYPVLKYLFHIPNGGSRHIAEAGKLKAMGVKRGVPDICLPVVVYKGLTKHYGLWIELKVGKNKTSNEQEEWLAYLVSQGYACYVAYGWEDARDMIINYLEG